MTRRDFHLLLFGTGLPLGSALAAWAADPKSAVYVDPAHAGPDYPLQGEYRCRAGEAPVGLQVIALGDEKFQAVFLPGGLPGEGWNGKTRVRVEGRREGETITFDGGGWRAKVSASGLTGTAPDGARLRGEKVHRRSPTELAKPPAGAVVLFDGSSTEAWVNGETTPEGWLKPGSRTKQLFQDFTLHAEFRTPFMPLARGQGRGNSGVYLVGRYEVQVLDSFGLEGKENECGGLYRQKAPDVNMCYPPLAWQTYDIDFRGARFDEQGERKEQAVITVRHNGVVIHDRVALAGPTGGAQRRPERGTGGAISLQNHGTPVVFRNLWLVEKK